MLLEAPAGSTTERTASEQAKWFAIQTRSRHEKKVATELREKGLSIFLPLYSSVHRWSDRRKTVQLPLFPGYVFVQTVYSPENRIAVLQVPGVAYFVGDQGRGTPIPEKQIEDIRTILDKDIPFEIYPFVKVGQRVRIRGGSLDGLEGTLLAKNADRSLAVSIELIQKTVVVRVTGYDLDVI